MYLRMTINERTKKQLPIYPITFGVDHCQQDTFRPKGTYFHHFLYVRQGEGLFNFDGRKKILSAGTVVFLHKAFPVDYSRVGAEFRTSWITFDGSGAEGIFDYFNISDYAILDHKHFGDKIEDICKLAERNAPWEVLSHKTYALALEFFSLLKKQNEPPVLEKAKAYMASHYGEDLSVETIANSLGVSQSLLFKLFHTEERTTPVEYLRDIRIRKAGQMLLSGNERISQIAAACGFSGVAYFCKVFKAQTGLSPLSYRKKFPE